MRTIVAAALAACIALPAAAQTACAPRLVMIEQLADGFGEGRTAYGHGGGVVMELFVNPGTRTWTLVVSRPDGVSCMIAAGDDWQDANLPKPPNG